MDSFSIVMTLQDDVVSPEVSSLDGEIAEFLFSSPHRSLQAQGVLARIDLPALGGEKTDSDFARSVREALTWAREQGQDDPVVLGAIPFDTSQPSALVVPQRSRFVTREEILAGARREFMCPQVCSSRSIPDEQDFKQGVRQAIANFQYSCIRKAVLSRLCEIELGEPLDTRRVLANLLAQNPSAYHFRMPLPDGTELIGASPELLLRKQGGRVRTFPLAGSAARQVEPERDQAVARGLEASAKDQHEHRLVVEDIRQVLAPLCDELSIPDIPEIVSTATLWHLGTPIEGRLKDEGLSVLELACRLHPTPAVCGFPRQQARKLVNLIEPFERGPFAGIVGWCDGQGDGEWVVTIRCATVQATSLRLFAGVGVVEASCPEAEWIETQVKLRTMLNACGLQPEVTTI